MAKQKKVRTADEEVQSYKLWMRNMFLAAAVAVAGLALGATYLYEAIPR